MQNIVTLGEINDALKIAAVSAAQLADMGFAALANKPICEGLPPEESRRLRNAKLYPAESIGQIRVALAQRFAEPTTAADVPASGAAALSEYLKTCEQHQIVPDVGGAFASAFAAGFNLASSQAAQREATAAIKTLQNLGYTYHDAELWKPPIGKVPDFDLVDSLRNRISELEASQAAPAAVAVPDDRAAFERELIDNHHYVPSDFSFKDGFYGGDDDYIQFGWDVWQARAALDATPAAPESAVQLHPSRAGRVYVAGPMTGLPDFNFPAFNAAAADLRAEGWHVENPAEHGIVDGAEWADYLHYDLGRLATCAAMYLLPGWSQSRGATLEVHVATALGMTLFYAEGAEIYRQPCTAAAPVVLPEPGEAIKEVMTLVELHRQEIIKVMDEEGSLVDVQSAQDAIESKLRALLATATGLPAQAVEPSDAELIALNAGECFFSESPSKYPELGHGTQYHGGAPGVIGFARAALALRADPAAYSQKFQQRVQPWMMACFGPEISADTRERNHRFLEEALELVQCLGCTASEAHQLVDYVYGRPWGEPAQEAGGVMVTLAALCLANGLDMHACGETELARIWTMVEAIRAKQAAKPKHSPLPMHAPQVEADARDAALAASEQDALRLVRQAVRDFHYALDNRKHGGVAAGAAMNAIELALNMYWQQGQEADRRANQATQGGE